MIIDKTLAGGIFVDKTNRQTTQFRQLVFRFIYSILHFYPFPFSDDKFIEFSADEGTKEEGAGIENLLIHLITFI
jgi:hypothetical protein